MNFPSIQPCPTNLTVRQLAVRSPMFSQAHQSHLECVTNMAGSATFLLYQCLSTITTAVVATSTIATIAVLTNASSIVTTSPTACFTTMAVRYSHHHLLYALQSSNSSLKCFNRLSPYEPLYIHSHEITSFYPPHLSYTKYHHRHYCNHSQ